MTAYMGCDIWHLYLINLVIPANHTVKSVFPMHGNQRHSFLIQKKKSSISTYHFLHFIFRSVLNDCSKHFCNFFCHWNYPCSGIRLCRLNHILHLRSSLQLMVDIDGFFSKSISFIVNPQNSEILITCMKKNVYYFIILAVNYIIMYKL